jgi:hypothetical protein
LLREAYAGKDYTADRRDRFLGTALVERPCVPCPTSGASTSRQASRGKSAGRAVRRDVLGAAAFRGLRERLGDGFEGYVSERVRVLEGDVHAASLGLARRTSRSSRARWTW